MLPVTRPVLISIKPQFVEMILAGEKVFEFRRVWAKSEPNMMVIYSSSPVQRIVAIARIKNVHKASTSSLWNLTKGRGGVSRQLLREYFSGNKTGYAIEIEDIKLAKTLIDPKILFVGFRPPQSFQYLDLAQYQKLLLNF